ncbi:MAG: hypothetical protein ABSF47_02105 [Minisyncoccia bacterium]|jgi:hypothetical protein
MTSEKIKFLSGLISLGTLLGALFLFPFVVIGQTTNPVIITWQANNYFPASYTGKAAVTPGTLVMASVETYQNNKLADLTGADIRWYVDNELVGNGTGMKTISFSAKQQQGGYQNLRVSVNVGNAPFENSIQIPISQPTVVISFPSPDKTVRAGSQIDLVAIPFFFNVNSLSDLKFTWLINDQQTANQDNQVSISVGTPQSIYQNSIPVAVTAQNSNNPYEFNRGFINLSITQ